MRRIHPEYYEAFLSDMKLRHPDDYAYVVAQYDGEISQSDAAIGRLLQALKSGKRWGKTIPLLLSDHGECFGEGNFYFDHHGLYDAVTRVAMLLHLPGQRAGRSDALVSTEDILPTFSELPGLSDTPYPLSGTSLLPLLNGTREAVRPYVVSAESTRQASLALRTLDWKAIMPIVEDAQGQPLPDFYGRPRRPDPLLFDLRSDPGETHDLSHEQPEKLAALLATLQNWRAEMAHITGEPDLIQSQGLTLPVERFIQRIQARR